MDQQILCFALLLAVCLRLNTEETLVKTIGRKPDFTPVCSNSTIITLIVCKIRRERSREECRLLYRHGHDFEHECDSRFKLMTDSQTVFLHLMNLTSEDSGVYTCDCSNVGGAYVLHLNVTVKGDDKASISPLKILISTTAVSSGMGFIIVTAVVFGLILKKKNSRENTKLDVSELTRFRTPFFVDQGDLYASLRQPASSIYQTISLDHPYHHADTDPANIYATVHRGTDGKVEDFCPIYNQ